MAFIAWLSHRSMAQVIREYVKEKAADLRDENPEAAKLFDESNE